MTQKLQNGYKNCQIDTFFDDFSFVLSFFPFAFA